MDRMILAEKLESLRKCVRRLEEKRAASIAELRADQDRQDILTLNLTRAVQLCVDMATHILTTTEEPAPATMGEAFDGLAHLGLIDSTLQTQLKAASRLSQRRDPQLSVDRPEYRSREHLASPRRFPGIGACRQATPRRSLRAPGKNGRRRAARSWLRDSMASTAFLPKSPEPYISFSVGLRPLA